MVVSVMMCSMIHVLKCFIEDSFKVEHTTHPGAAGAADSGGWDRGLWVRCRVLGRRTANCHEKLFCGWLFSGGWILCPLPSLGTRCPLLRLLARDGLCVE